MARINKRWKFLCRDANGDLVFTHGLITPEHPVPEVWIIGPEWFWSGKRARADYFPAH